MFTLHWKLNGGRGRTREGYLRNGDPSLLHVGTRMDPSPRALCSAPSVSPAEVSTGRAVRCSRINNRGRNQAKMLDFLHPNYTDGAFLPFANRLDDQERAEISWERREGGQPDDSVCSVQNTEATSGIIGILVEERDLIRRAGLLAPPLEMLT